MRTLFNNETDNLATAFNQGVAPASEPKLSRAETGDIYNEGGIVTYGSTGHGGKDPRGRVQGAGDNYDNTLHGIDISVNDWVGGGLDFGEFDSFSSQLGALEGGRGTESTYNQVKSLLDSRGFRYSSEQIAYWAPEGAQVGGGGGGGPAADTTPKPFTDRIEDAAEAPREEITPTASGLEDTPIVEDTVDTAGVDETIESVIADQAESDPNYVDRSSADDEVEEARVVNNFAPIEPSNIVVDPATGQEFASPASARQAGITNWVYKDDYQG